MLHIHLGDITAFEADAIVNAANPQLARGGGVCGAIHAAGGPQIEREAQAFVAAHGPVAAGGAALTTGGDLPARYVIHAVGPIWAGGGQGEPELLASAYRRAVEIADANDDITSLAFPSISTGIFGFPVELAAPIALAAVRDALERAHRVETATFVLFDRDTYAAYESALAAL